MIKVTENKTEDKPLSFPRFMRHKATGCVYLVTKDGENYKSLLVVDVGSADIGTIIRPSGYHLDTYYEDFTGSLSNAD